MEYINHGMASPQPHEGHLLQGYSRVVPGNVVAYTNGKPKQANHRHSDGSKLIEGGYLELLLAETALTCGELQIISKVQGPQTS